jgi:Zn-dependent protease with chaperone function
MQLDRRIQSMVKGTHIHSVMLGDSCTLLELPLDDNRIAAVLGHELSHCLLRHNQEQRGDSLIKELLRCSACPLMLSIVFDHGVFDWFSPSFSIPFLSILELPFLSGITGSSFWASAALEWLSLKGGDSVAKLLVDLPYSRLHEYNALFSILFVSRSGFWHCHHRS